MKLLSRSLARWVVSLVLLGLSTLTVPFLARPAAAAAPDREDAVQVFNRDVYIVESGALQNPNAGTPPDAPLYNVNGAPLGLTWGQWSAATGSSSARTVIETSGLATDVRLRLSGLVPGGIYSVFYGTFQPDSENPLCPDVERTLALTAFHPERQVPDPSSFVAGANGRAHYHGRVDGALLEATQVFFSIVYHADGHTYHPLPNRGEFFTQGDDCRSSYGDDAMRHVVVLQKW
jgi:hypothetical protein